MFFNREKPHEPAFEDRIANIRKLGFDAKDIGGGRCRVARAGIAAIVTPVSGKPPRLVEEGLLMGNEIGLLTHGGYQMFFVAPSGARRPALASQLHDLHSFDEDLREGLGMVSLYNEGLGSTAERHMYDRLEDRDHGPKKAFAAK